VRADFKQLHLLVRQLLSGLVGFSSIMATLLQTTGLLLFLALWGAAWRKQPNLAFGIFLGVGIAAVVAVFVRRFDVHNVPLWLPPLPFAVVAISLLCFGIWAWRLGRHTG
jgi:hypothetical protein